MRDGFKLAVAAVVGAIVLAVPDQAKEKLRAAGDILQTATEESVDAVNTGMGGLQNVGNGTDGSTAGPTDTTAPVVGSGRG